MRTATALLPLLLAVPTTTNAQTEKGCTTSDILVCNSLKTFVHLGELLQDDRDRRLYERTLLSYAESGECWVIPAESEVFFWESALSPDFADVFANRVPSSNGGGMIEITAEMPLITTGFTLWPGGLVYREWPWAFGDDPNGCALPEEPITDTSAPPVENPEPEPLYTYRHTVGTDRALLAPYAPDSDPSPPERTFGITAEYTKDALARKVEGIVVLDTIIDYRGRPSGIWLIRSLDPGLDANAIAAVRKWRFQPGRSGRTGESTNTLIRIEFEFRLPTAP